jgi:aminocarboxymuconate-semialdehyde decarboxylase
MKVESTSVDTHCHYWPSGMIDAFRDGRRWHAWSGHTNPDGTGYVECDLGTAPFRPQTAHEDWTQRLASRRADRRIDVEAVMVPAFLFGYHMRPSDAAAYCREINDELAQIQRDHPDRVIGLGVLPLQDQKETRREVERAVKDLGLRGFGIGTHVMGRNMDDPAVVPVLEEIVAADAAVMMHPNWFMRAGEDRLTRYYFGNSFGVPLEAGLAIMSIAYSGLLDRRPDARIGVTHGGGWLPYGIGRLLLRTGQGKDGGGRLQEPIDLYLRRFYYDCLIHDEHSLDLLVRRVGADRIMIGTDYPFQGDIPGGAVDWIDRSGTLSTREKEMIIGGNAHRFLRLPRG